MRCGGFGGVISGRRFGGACSCMVCLGQGAMGFLGQEALRVFVGGKWLIQPLVSFERLSKGSMFSGPALGPKLPWIFSLRTCLPGLLCFPCMSGS